MVAGIPPWRLWSLTPSEISLALQGAKLRQKAEHDLALTAAWANAALTRSRGRRMPSLRSFLRQPHKRLKRLTQAEREAKKAAILAQFPDAAVPELVATNGADHG